MYSEEYIKIQRQLDLTNQRLDQLTTLMQNLNADLGVNRGLRIYQVLEQMSGQLSQLTRDMNQGEVKVMSYRIDSLMKSVDKLRYKPIEQS